MKARARGGSAAAPRPLIIWGAGGHAEVVADVVRAGGTHEIVAFLDDVTAGERPSEWLGAPLHRELVAVERLRNRGGEADLPELLVAVGDCRGRLACAARAAAAGFTSPAQVHPRATVAPGVELGDGTVVMPGAIIAPGARIGAHVIVNTGAIIEHHASVGDGAHIAPGVIIGARARVERAAFVGMGTTVRGGITIHDEGFVGAGSLVLHDVAAGEMAYGVPARAQGRRPAHD